MNIAQDVGAFAFQGMQNALGSAGSRGVSSFKPIAVGSKVLIVSNRPFMRGVVVEVAGRFKDEVEYALVRRAAFSWFGKAEKDEWESCHSLAPIDEVTR